MPRIHSTDLIVSDVGGTLLLKLCGFVLDQAAEIRDVSEHRLTVRLGRSWFGRLMWGDQHPHRLDIAIEFAAIPMTDRRHTCSRVRIEIRDAQWGAGTVPFDEAVRRVMWKLRSALLVA